MAKKTMDWTYDGSTLKCEHLDVTPTVKQDFDLTLLFPTFLDFSEVGMEAAVYGIKQKLADACARPKELKLTQAERKEVIQTTYDRITDPSDPKWNAPKEAGERISVKKVEAKASELDLTDEQKELMDHLGLKY